MKVVVLNGSPKGDLSVTMQYVHFIQKKFPHHEWKIFNIAQLIIKIEKDEQFFQEIIDTIQLSDFVLWAFPLYVFLVHAHYKRFIEIIIERHAENVFNNKYTAVLTTSIHFFDHTAHNYMNAVCDDLSMKYVGSFSAEMNDLLKEQERDRLFLFAEYVFDAVEKNFATSKVYSPLLYQIFDYIPGEVKKKLDAGSKKIIIVSDQKDSQTNLGKMIDRFKNCFTHEIETINLNNLDIKGSCLGCIQCGFNNTCIYQGKDEFIDFYNTKIRSADVLVFAGTIQDRYLSSRWKIFFDRSFFNTHIPSLIGKQIGFIISGPFRQIPNLKQILDAYAENQRANLVDIVTDEYEHSEEIDSLLQTLAQNLNWFGNKHYIKPATYLGVGGRKIFRDEIWGRLRFPFQADHTFYKKYGFYDFPQKNFKERITNAILILLTKVPAIRKKIYTKRLKEEMVKPFRKVLKKV